MTIRGGTSRGGGPREPGGTNKTGMAASQVLDAAGELSEQSERLSGDVQRFIIDVKAA